MNSKTTSHTVWLGFDVCAVSAANRSPLELNASPAEPTMSPLATAVPVLSNVPVAELYGISCTPP